jgi:hypothetical protein
VPARGAPVSGARAPVGSWIGRAGGKGRGGEEKKKRREKEKEGKGKGKRKEKKRRKNRERDFGKIRKIVRENWEGF